MKKKNLLIWLDLEMTGLDPNTNTILEMATLITDAHLTEVATGPTIAIHQSDHELAKMDQWNQQHHKASGLIDRVRTSKINMQQAQQSTLNFIKQHVPANTSPLCGNSVGTDRKFLVAYMPELEAYFHYRVLDVSTVKILATLWYPEIAKKFVKESKHQALDDIRDSIEELQYYRNTVFIHQ